jgi:hypothetical protein
MVCPLEQASLLHSGGGRIPSSRTAVMENGGIHDGGNRSGKTNGSENGMDQVLH